MKASTIASRVLTALAVFSPIVLPVFTSTEKPLPQQLKALGCTFTRLLVP